jgi:hypothetical protein
MLTIPTKLEVIKINEDARNLSVKTGLPVKEARHLVCEQFVADRARQQPSGGISTFSLIWFSPVIILLAVVALLVLLLLL